MKLIDLHVHSTASDGTLSPHDLAFYAQARGLSAIALTDHDTVSGIDECLKAGEAASIKVIPGIEFSADFHGKEVHILGYGIHHQHPQLLHALETLKKNRSYRNLKILEKLQALGFELSLEDFKQGTATYTTITRAHIARTLVQKGYVPNLQTAFSQYLGDGKPAFVPKQALSVQECTTLIHDVGGVAVLAHPMLYGYDYKDLTQILKGLVLEGIDGIECFYSSHSKQDIAFLIDSCKRMQLFPTGGSDFHGENRPLVDLGSGYGNLKVPATLLDALLSQCH